MTEREALKMALESLIVSLPDLKGYWKIKAEDAIKAAKEALAQPEQEFVATVQCINGVTIGYLEVMQPVGTKLYTTPPQQERNFCPRCGKRLGKNDWDAHTCTPPRCKE